MVLIVEVSVKFIVDKEIYFGLGARRVLLILEVFVRLRFLGRASIIFLGDKYFYV